MAQQLSHLRVTAEMDVSAYVRGMQQKVAVDRAGAESMAAVGDAMARMDFAAGKTGDKVSALSKRFIDGYSATERFFSGLKEIEIGMARFGLGGDRAAVALEKLYRQFGMVADAQTVANRGLVMIAPRVAELTDHYNAQAAAMERAAQVQRNLATAQNMQTGIASRLGIGRDVYDAAGSASVFQQRFADEQKVLSAIRAAQSGSNFQNSYNAAMGIGEAGKSARDSASAFIEAAKAADEYANRLIKVRAEVFPLEAAKNKHKERVREYLKLFRNGDFSKDEYSSAAQVSLRVMDQEKSAINGMRIHGDKYANGSGLARHEAINLSRQIQDVVVSLQGGQAPMTVLLQQGTQIADIFASSQSTVGGFLQSVVGWLTPARLAMGGFATAALAAGYAVYSFSDSQRDLQNSLMGIGRGAGVTATQLNAIAEAAANVGNVSRSSAREAAGIFAATGRIDGSMIGQLTGASRAYGLMTGQDTAAAAKALAAGFADPAKGAEQLNEKLGFLNDRTLQYIKNAQAAGDRTGAQKALFDAMNPTLADAEKRVGLLAKAWEAVAKGISNAMDVAGKRIVGQTSFADQIADLENRRAAVQRQREARLPTILKFSPSDANSLLFARLGQAYESTEARLKGQNIQSNLDSTQGAAVVRSLVGDIERLSKLQNDKGILEKVIGDPQTLAKMGMNADQAKDALNRVSAALANFETEAQKAVSDGKLQLQQIAAYTLGERAAVEAERARIEAIRQMKGETIAAIEAENARNRVVAEANRQARDTLRDAQSDAKLVGLSPFQRMIQQERNRQERERDTLTNMSGAGVGALSGTPAAIPADFASRMQQFITALGDSGARMTSGTRTFEQQAALFEKYGPGKAARPGSSQHEHGTAQDWVFSSAEKRQQAMALAAQYGIRSLSSNGGAVHFDMGRGGARAGAQSGSISATGDIQRAGDTRMRSLISEQQFEPINAANRALDAQVNALEMQRAAFGLSTAEIAKSNAEQQLYNQYIQSGIPITDEMRARISAYGNAAAAQSENVRKFNFAQKQLEEWKGFEQSTFVGFWNDFGQAIRNGESGMKALEKAGVNALGKIADKLMSMAADGLWNAAFGGSSGGLFGGLLKGIIGGFGGGATGSPLNILPSANGNIFMGGNVVPFATGGIVGSPTYFPMRGGRTGLMGEAGPEAIMPLRRDSAGRLGIAAAGVGTSVRLGDTSIVINGNMDDQRFAELRMELDRRDAGMRAALQQTVGTEPRRRASFDRRHA